MILTVCGTKGGCGKSTIATNLAVIQSMAGKDVLLVDADEQRSAMKFSMIRSQEVGNAGFTTVLLVGPTLRSEIMALKPKYDVIIIDTGGHDTTSKRAALTVADVAIAPFRPSGVDILTMEDMDVLLAEIKTVNHRMKAYSFLNMVLSQGDGADAAQEALAESTEMEYLDCRVGHRKSFQDSWNVGKSVIELKRDSKAIGEISVLSELVFGAKVK